MPGAPPRRRRCRRLFVGALALGVLAGTGWYALPLLLPEPVIRHSPWLGPVLRAYTGQTPATRADLAPLFHGRLVEDYPEDIIPAFAAAGADADRELWEDLAPHCADAVRHHHGEHGGRWLVEQLGRRRDPLELVLIRRCADTMGVAETDPAHDPLEPGTTDLLTRAYLYGLLAPEADLDVVDLDAVILELVSQLGRPDPRVVLDLVAFLRRLTVREVVDAAAGTTRWEVFRSRYETDLLRTLASIVAAPPPGPWRADLVAAARSLVELHAPPAIAAGSPETSSTPVEEADRPPDDRARLWDLALDDGQDEDLRRRALARLHEMSDDGQRAVLLRDCLARPDAVLAEGARDLLVTWQDRPPEDLLAALLEDYRSPRCGTGTAAALARWADGEDDLFKTVVSDLATRDLAVQAAVLGTWAAEPGRRDWVVAVMRRLLDQETLARHVALAAMATLEPLPLELVDGLVGCLDLADPLALARALHHLGRCPSPEGVPVQRLVELLGHDDPLVADEAASLLALVSPDPAVHDEALARLLGVLPGREVVDPGGVIRGRPVHLEAVGAYLTATGRRGPLCGQALEAHALADVPWAAAATDCLLATAIGSDEQRELAERLVREGNDGAALRAARVLARDHPDSMVLRGCVRDLVRHGAYADAATIVDLMGGSAVDLLPELTALLAGDARGTAGALLPVLARFDDPGVDAVIRDWCGPGWSDRRRWAVQALASRPASARADRALVEWLARDPEDDIRQAARDLLDGMP